MAKKIITKEQIFETGVRLAQSMPPGSLTVAAVCAEMGIVKSTFYRHYRSLKDLFTDSLYGISEDVLQKLPEIVLSEMSNVKKIEMLWKAGTDKLVEYGPRVMGYMLQCGDQKVDEKHFYIQEPFAGTIKTLIRKAQKTGEISNKSDPSVLFFSLHLFFSGLNISWAIGDGSFDYSTYLLQGIWSVLGIPIPETHIFLTIPIDGVVQ